MSYNVVVCDDENIQVNTINRYIKKVAGEINIKVNITNSNTGEELLQKVNDNIVSIKDTYIFFLDIEMKGMDGVQLAKKINSINKDAIVVYITGFKDYAVKAFEVRAFNYLMKPVLYEDFKHIFIEVLNRLKEIYYRIEKEKEFVIENRGDIRKIKYDDIYYFEKILRKVKLVHKNGEIEFYMTLKKLKANIDMDNFTQCHQSFIVNNDKIDSYKNREIHMKDIKYNIPVSKRWISEVKNTLSHKIFN